MSVVLALAIIAAMVGMTSDIASRLLGSNVANAAAMSASEISGDNGQDSAGTNDSLATAGFEPTTPLDPALDPQRRDPQQSADLQRPLFTTTATAGALDPATVPARLVIPSIAVDAPIDPVGVDDQERMEIPTSGSRIGWYQRGAIPGEGGTAVFAAHVDTAAEGPGALFGLRRLNVGDEILIVDGSGDTSTWTIVAMEQQHKDDLPRTELYDASGPPRIAVVTCAGRFNASTRSYEDNLIAWAQPA